MSLDPNPASALDEALEAFRAGRLTPDQLLARIDAARAESLPGATLDHDRTRRCGASEVVFAAGKTTEQLLPIVDHLTSRSGVVLVTRASAEQVSAVRERFSDHPIEVNEPAGTLLLGTPEVLNLPPIPVVTAGTSDVPVAEEARLTCKALGQRVTAVDDVGVAGIHRLLGRAEALREARVIICCAGMEGALPSAVGGLVDAPIVAVPTSVGYGAALGGWAALLGMLTSCASGVVTVNIDNGFGAAYAACKINRLGGSAA